VVGAGVVICLELGADLHVAQLMPLPLTVSCFSKIQIGFTFLVPAHPGSPGQWAVKRLCVCVTARTNNADTAQALMLSFHLVSTAILYKRVMINFIPATTVTSRLLKERLKQHICGTQYSCNKQATGKVTFIISAQKYQLLSTGVSTKIRLH